VLVNMHVIILYMNYTEKTENYIFLFNKVPTLLVIFYGFKAPEQQLMLQKCGNYKQQYFLVLFSGCQNGSNYSLKIHKQLINPNFAHAAIIIMHFTLKILVNLSSTCL
jgi:hypothetical protein